MKFQDIFKRIKFNFFLRHKIKIEKYIFTIGAPRSGTTFLCQLLNSHPNILISNEDRTIDNILNKNINFDEAITNSNISAFEQFKNGYKINKKFQGKWNDINKKKILKKKIYLLLEIKSLVKMQKFLMQKKMNLLMFS